MKLVDRLEQTICNLVDAGFPEQGKSIKSIRDAITRLGPYEPGEIVEVSNYADFNIKIRGGYIGALYEGVVVERGDDNSIEYFPYHRPLQKYVNVKLPVELVTMAKRTHKMQEYETEDMGIFSICEAIAEGAEECEK